MKTKTYTMLGWMAWQGMTIIARRKLSEKKVKLGAAATVGLVLVAGLVAAKATTASDD